MVWAARADSAERQRWRSCRYRLGLELARGGMVVAFARSGALERAAGLRQEYVVERRLVQSEVRDRQSLSVECADDLGECFLGAVQPNSDALDRPAAILAEALEHGRDGAAVLRVGGDRFERRAPDLGLECTRGSLGDDFAVVDDPDP